MKRGTPEHPKTVKLCELLKLRRWEAVGILESLWLWAAKYALQGDIGKYSDAAIAHGLDWNRSPERLIEALVTAGWVERCGCHRLMIHDWEDHADQTVRRVLAKRGLVFIKHDASTKLADARPAEPKAWNETSQPLPLPLPKAVIQEPIPEPQPKSVVRVPVAADLTEPQGAKFEEWWRVWSSVRGTFNRTQAAHAYMSVVPASLEGALFECTRSYLASLENPSKGFNPENFLFVQAKDKFNARWPSRIPSPHRKLPPGRTLSDPCPLCGCDELNRLGQCAACGKAPELARQLAAEGVRA